VRLNGDSRDRTSFPNLSHAKWATCHTELAPLLTSVTYGKVTVVDNTQIAGRTADPFGLTPVADPRIRSGCFERCLPAEAGNTNVTVPVAPGAKLVAGREEIRILLPKKPRMGATLLALLFPLFVTEILTMYSPLLSTVMDASFAVMLRYDSTVKVVEPLVLPSFAVIVV
jgi:hypothetical protein